MRLSKMTLAVLLLALSACTKPDSKPDGVNGNQGTEGSASFRIKSMEGDGQLLNVDQRDPKTNLTTASVWKVPRVASYRFTACIEDRSTRAKATGHRFDVEDPLTHRRLADVPATTGEGCFSWHEDFPFTFFVRRSRWVVIERDIVGTGIHTGRQRVQLALNPWAVAGRDPGDSFRYLRDKPLNPTLLSEPAKADTILSGAALGEDKLYIGDVDIQTIRTGEDKSGTMLRLNISMKPKVRFETLEGQPIYRPVLAGDFYVIAHLVLNNTGPKLNERVILSSPAENSELQKKYQDLGIAGTGKVIDGKLIARVSAFIHGRLPQGNLELVLKVIPKGIRGISPAEGIYELGSFRNLSSSFSGDLNKACREEDKGCDIADYLRGSTNFEEMRKLKYGADNSPYLFDRMNLRFAQVEPGETTTQRTVTYTASTCITDAFTGERPVGLPFVIKYKETGEVIHDQKTGEDGCLRWSSSIFHKYYQPEQFLERNVTIVKDSGFERQLRFYINPWDDKFTFGFDEREFKPEFWVTLRSRRKIPSRFFMADFGYHTVRFQYNIDSLMALEVKKTVLMELDPRVLRYSGIINARKMTEPLRDGIWLMKVGIQKNYLDPAQQGVHIDALKEAQSQDGVSGRPADSEKGLRVDGVQAADSRNARTRLRNLGIDVPQREFISTQKALVRSTDGAIIQPVEFSMQDLRMMRVRSNFLIELQPVDERQLQVENVLRGNFGSYLEKLNQERKAQNASLGRRGENETDLEKMRAEEDARVNARIEERRKTTRALFGQIASVLKNNNVSGVSYEPFKLNSEQMAYFGRDIQELLDENLQANDFTTIKLPPCSEIDCDKFVEQGDGPDDKSEKGPGLVRRTFVGPVIFLSNGYKDSVRATDNLDEAKCGQKVQFDDEREREMDEYRRKLFAESEQASSKTRENTLYKFSEYFGSLRHLCNSHVDDLISREDKYHYIYESNIPAVGSVYNFTKAYSMNFLSLADERPKAVNFDAETFQRCNNNLTGCMRETSENWVSLEKALRWVNSNMALSMGFFAKVRSWFAGTKAWEVADIQRALFGQKDESARRYAACALVTGSFIESLKANGAKFGSLDGLTMIPYVKSFGTLHEEVLTRCLANHVSPVFFDQKLRVFKTGQSDDSYVFLGGYQMNINVGQSFSVGRSSGYSLGMGMGGTDFVGSAGGISGSLGRLAAGNPGGGLAAVGAAGLSKAADRIAPFTSLIKPFSVKAGWSTGMSESDGTSISESTYLVAQIAKFRVRLDEYERCYALSFTKEFLRALEIYGVMTYNPSRHGPAKSMFVCEGKSIKQPRYVDEMYFYFTQHFTEGDMLDQADLYNHPWLLALRGYRDFGSFISLIRKQDGISFWEMTKNMVSPVERKVDWPLSHMRDAYKKIVPSFPGFYTVLDEQEGLTQFPLEMTKSDLDMNFEVRSKERRSEQRRDN
jgi:hypothetical protein